MLLSGQFLKYDFLGLVAACCSCLTSSHLPLQTKGRLRQVDEDMQYFDLLAPPSQHFAGRLLVSNVVDPTWDPTNRK